MIVSYDYYVNSYYGDKILKEEWSRYEKQAESYLNLFIRRRLPLVSRDEATQTAVKNAICSIANGLVMIRKREVVFEKMNAGGAISSISSGKESISFEKSGLDKAVYDENEKQKYLYDLCRKYLIDAVDINGRYLLYWGC